MLQVRIAPKHGRVKRRWQRRYKLFLSNNQRENDSRTQVRAPLGRTALGFLPHHAEYQAYPSLIKFSPFPFVQTKELGKGAGVG